MKVVARLVLLFILTCSTCFGQTVVFKDSAGRYAGSASTSRNITTLRDSSGRYSGYNRYNGGKTSFYDAKGRYSGQASGKVIVSPFTKSK
jgi:hypothetical protein